MVDLKSFLERNIEGYLFGDLERMRNLQLGYPPLMTVFAGVELLGGLTRPKKPGPGDVRFNYYWMKFLYPDEPDKAKLGVAVYALARHGIAHGFFPKGMVAVGGDESKHLERDDEGYLIIHPGPLGDDFKRSYEERLKPLLADANMANRMRDRLERMLNEANKSAKRLGYSDAKFATAPSLALEAASLHTVTSSGVHKSSSFG